MEHQTKQPNKQPDNDELTLKKLLRKIAVPLLLWIIVMPLWGWHLYEVPPGKVFFLVSLSGLYGGGVFTRILKHRIGKNPEMYRKYTNLPIARVGFERKGGRHQGSLGGRNSILHPSLEDKDTLAFHREAKRIWEEEGYKKFVAYCKTYGENESTVRGRLKRYRDQIDGN